MMSKEDARNILTRCHAEGDFHALRTEVVERIIAEANLHKYRSPKNANGSRARCFHSYLRRRAGV